MRGAWEVLVRAGVPAGAIRPAPRSLPATSVRRAIGQVERRIGSLDAGRREALFAWLRAFARGWPRAFEEVAGSAGRRLLDRLGSPTDANRYLKLRRIAGANLARAL